MTKLLICVFVISFSALNLGADTVVMKNGDRLTGEVGQLEKGKLALKTAYAGTLRLDWREVASVETGKPFEVEVENGRRYSGAVGLEGGAVSVVGNQAPLVTTQENVVGIVPVELDGGKPSFWTRVNGAMDLGYSLNRGNSTLTQSSLGVKGEYRGRQYKVRGDLDSLFAKQNDAPTTSQHSGNLRYEHLLSDRMFYFVVGGMDRDDRRRLNLRTRGGGGFGWTLRKTREEEFSALGGLTYSNENFRGTNGEPDRILNSSEGLLGFEWETRRFAGIRLSTEASLLPNLGQRGRYRVRYESTARIPVWKYMNWTVRVFDNFDSEPQREGVLRNDYGLVSGVGLSF